MGKTFTSFLLLLFISFQLQAQLSREQQLAIKEEATQQAKILAQIFSNQDTAALKNHILTWEQYQEWQKEMMPSDEKAIRNQNRFGQNYYEQMKAKIWNTYNDAQKKSMKQYGNSNALNIKDTRVSMKSDSEKNPFCTVSMEYENNYKKNILRIDGLMKWKGQWWILGGYFLILPK